MEGRWITMATIGTVASRGCDLYYEQAGKGTPILLVHPAGATASTWGRAKDALADQGQVITYDRRGYERTGGQVVHSIAVHTDDAANLLDGLALQPAVAVGVSAGASIVIDLAVRRPDLVRVAIAHEAPWRALRRPPTRPQLEAVAKIASLTLRHRHRDAAEAILRLAYTYRDGTSAWDDFPEEWHRIALANARPTVADFWNSIGNYPKAADLATVRSPVVLTYGARSIESMSRFAHALASAIPGGQTQEIEGAGHAAPFDATSSFVRMICDAIDRTS